MRSHRQFEELPPGELSYENLVVSRMLGMITPIDGMLMRLERVEAAISRLVLRRCGLTDAHMACIGRLESLKYDSGYIINDRVVFVAGISLSTRFAGKFR